LLWKNVLAPLVSATDYPVEYWVSDLQLNGYNFRFTPTYQNPGGSPPTATAEQPGKVVLVNKSFTGTLELVLSLYDGAVIQENELFEAFPMWRPLFTASGGGS
jgi:hypothetical protein